MSVALLDSHLLVSEEFFAAHEAILTIVDPVHPNE
jgi:hypothetical protein